MKDPYLYPNSDILKNLFNETNESKFNVIEADYTSLRIKELLDNPISGEFNLEHLYKIHKYIFQDIFDWAGLQRKINIEKAEEALLGLSIEYADVFDIERQVESALLKLNSVDWNILNNEKKAIVFAEHMSNIWKIHPFREGNTRTVIIFCCDFAEKKEFTRAEKGKTSNEQKSLQPQSNRKKMEREVERESCKP